MTSPEENDVISELNDITQCSICLRTFLDPRILPCIHTFCLRCLQEMGKKQDKTPGSMMPCPICRRLFSIPDNSFTSLNKNFFMTKLIHMTKKLDLKGKKDESLQHEITTNKTDSTSHSSLNASGGGEEEEEDDEEEDEKASRHSDVNCILHSANLDVYCHDCQCLICLKCLIDGHQGHRGATVAEVATVFRQEIQSNIDKLSSFRFLSQNLSQRSEKQKQEMMKELESRRLEIKRKSEELKNMIDQHARKLLDDFSTMEREKVKEVEILNSEAERYEMMLSGLEVYCMKVLLKGSATDVCRLKNELQRRTKELEELLSRTEIHSVKVSFKATNYEKILRKENSLVGKIEVTTQKMDSFEASVMIVGFDQDQLTTSKTLKLDLHDQPEISVLDRDIPATLKPGVAAAANCNILYVTGLGEEMNEVWRFHLVFGWSKCGHLIQSRVRHCVGFIGDVLYVCGGYNEAEDKVLDSVEAFDTVTCRCMTVGQMSCSVQYACCIPVEQLLYVFCGLNENNVTAEHVQVYDTVNNVCRLVVEPIPNPYNPTQAWRAVILEKFIFLLGRWTCFLFDVEAETWTEKRNLRTDVDHFGVAQNNGQIFVFGGGIDAVDEVGRWSWVRCDDIKCLSVVDSKRKVFGAQWKSVGNLPCPTLVHAFAVLKFPAE